MSSTFRGCVAVVSCIGRPSVSDASDQGVLQCSWCSAEVFNSVHLPGGVQVLWALHKCWMLDCALLIKQAFALQSMPAMPAGICGWAHRRLASVVSM